MPFSFNPGQEQPIQAPAAAQAPAVSNDGVPVLNVPVAPTISLTPVAETISPFAFRNRSKSKFGMYFQFGVFAIFGVMVLASISLYVYQGIVSLQVSGKQADLLAAEASFPKNLPIEDMKKLSTRIALINRVVNERASVRAGLAIVEDTVNNPVTYTKFSMTKGKKGDQYIFDLAGETNSYEALYQQLDVLKNKVFSSVLPKLEFSGIGPLDNKGIASFKVSGDMKIAGLDPDTDILVDLNKVSDGTTTNKIETSSQNVNNGTTSTTQASSTMIQ